MQRTPLHLVLVLRVLTRLCVGSPHNTTPQIPHDPFPFQRLSDFGIDELIANDPPENRTQN